MRPARGFIFVLALLGLFLVTPVSVWAQYGGCGYDSRCGVGVGFCSCQNTCSDGGQSSYGWMCYGPLGSSSCNDTVCAAATPTPPPYSYGQAGYYSYGEAGYYSYGQASYYTYGQGFYAAGVTPTPTNTPVPTATPTFTPTPTPVPGAPTATPTPTPSGGGGGGGSSGGGSGSSGGGGGVSSGGSSGGGQSSVTAQAVTGGGAGGVVLGSSTTSSLGRSVLPGTGAGQENTLQRIVFSSSVGQVLGATTTSIFNPLSLFSSINNLSQLFITIGIMGLLITFILVFSPYRAFKRLLERV